MVESMKGDIAIAGFMITAEEWQAHDALARAQLVAVITRREDGLVPLAIAPVGSERTAVQNSED
jgi:hypothetical protein